MTFAEEYTQYLITHIKPICRPTSGGRWLNCRCFYCPDSKNPNHAHMYISVPQSENDVSVYYCQKCKSVGLVISQKLINDITSGKVSIDDCKIKIDTVTDSRIKSKIKYVGENRKWCNKWGF